MSNNDSHQPAALPAWWGAFICNVGELPDRNSPDDEPEAMVATERELEGCALRAIEQMAAEQAAAGAAQRACGHPIGTTRWCPDCELAERKAPG